MKIFLTWSGSKSKRLAEIIRNWIPCVIQVAKPYFSPDDVEKGARWYPEIVKELEESKVGIICLTRENLEAPWILFETGALAKTIEKSRVIPMLFGLSTADIKGPLSHFQGAVFGKEEINKVVRTINSALGEKALESGVIESVFEKWWPDLESKVAEVMKEDKDEDRGELRNDREILEEILDLTRAINTKFLYRLPMDWLLCRPVSDLNLPDSIMYILKNAEIHSIGDLVSFTEDQLLMIKNSNKRLIYKIKEELSALGLSLGMSPLKE